MRNVRREFPQWVSPVNSFQDAVTILKSKRILHEADLTGRGRIGGETAQNSEVSMMDSSLLNPYKAAKIIASRYGDVPSQEAALKVRSLLLDRAGVEGMFDKDDMRDFISDLTSLLGKQLPVKSPNDAAYIQRVEQDIENEYGDMERRQDRDIASMQPFIPEAAKANPKAVKAAVESYMKDTMGNEQKAIEAAAEEFKITKEEVRSYLDNKLNESLTPEGSYKKVTGKDLYSEFPELDRLNPYEVKKGMAIEMDMQYTPIPNFFTEKFNPDAVRKAAKKVSKNLQKDPAYYTNSISAVTEKRSGLEQHPKELKKGPDGMTKIKGYNNAPANTQDSLGNKEKAKSKNAEGVKIMKETTADKLRKYILKEYMEVGEPKQKFAKGQKVMTPEGLVGTIQEMTPDNTAILELENGKVVHKQGNVLKPHEDRQVKEYEYGDEDPSSPDYDTFARQFGRQPLIQQAKNSQGEEFKVGDMVTKSGSEGEMIKITGFGKDRRSGKMLAYYSDSGSYEGLGQIPIDDLTKGLSERAKKVKDLTSEIVKELKKDINEDLFIDPSDPTKKKTVVASTSASKNVLRSKGFTPVPNTGDVK